MKVKCIDSTKNLTYGREYEVIGNGVTCYALRGDDGVVRNYSKNRFHKKVE